VRDWRRLDINTEAISVSSAPLTVDQLIEHYRQTELTDSSSKTIASQAYLYPAAVKAAVFEAIEERDQNGKVIRVRYFDASGKPIKRWGFHNLRHSLGSWMVFEWN
jgi:hypothetical protein